MEYNYESWVDNQHLIVFYDYTPEEWDGGYLKWSDEVSIYRIEDYDSGKVIELPNDTMLEIEKEILYDIHNPEWNLDV